MYEILATPSDLALEFDSSGPQLLGYAALLWIGSVHRAGCVYCVCHAHSRVEYGVSVLAL